MQKEKKKIIVSAADSKYCALLHELISSIRDNELGRNVTIGVLDVGLTENEQKELSKRVEHVVVPDWDYDFAGRINQPQHFKAMMARPHLPKYFPGYDIIMWMDADTWVQRWWAVQHYFDSAEQKGLTISQEMDRSYANVYNLNNSRPLFFDTLNRSFGEQAMQHVGWMPMVNCGVFAMPANSHYWSAWQQALGRALQRYVGFFSEQTALNFCIYSQLPLPYFLPATFNWICVHAVPLFDEQRLSYVDPLLPHDEIGIIHLTGMGTRLEYQVTNIHGKHTKMNLRYFQWKQCIEANRSILSDSRNA